MIKIENIGKIYGQGKNSYEALKGVSLFIDKGEFVAIMGPSGSGKSTLMHILGCLDNPTSGKYFFEGEDVSKKNQTELADIRLNKIGFVFQSFNLLPRTNVLRNVFLPLVYAGVPEENRYSLAREALLNAGLGEEFYLNFGNQLSGGQVQRVAIARALVNKPSILLADEPTGNLDTKTGQVVLQTFQKLNKENNVTIVLITHEPEVAKYAKRIITIRDGQIILDEKVNKI